MGRPRPRAPFRFGVLGALVLLSAFFSIVTVREQQPAGESAARALARTLAGRDAAVRVVVVGRAGDEDRRFTRELAARLTAAGKTPARVVNGDPGDVRAALEAIPAGSGAVVIATVASYAPAVRLVAGAVPTLQGADVVTPAPYRRPTFLLKENLLNVANQIAVIAILAIGLTLVILTGGIDLSVGSLIALAAVLVTWGIGRLGGESCSAAGMLGAALATILLCGLAGAFSGAMITRFHVPPFIATLGVMQVASGLAYLVSEGKPIYQVPAGFVTLGRGADALLGVPYAVWLTGLLYLAAHLVVSRTVPGRALYAVGGNAEAARLAGVRVPLVLTGAYVASGVLAGLGGVVMASQLRSGAPTYGLAYELYVIAAVVVGGTSLSGGEGTIPGTLVGALIIAVIQNGMNLTNVESYTQKVVLGLVILGAVLLDRAKRRGER